MSAAKVCAGAAELVFVRDAMWGLVAGSFAALGLAGAALLAFPEPWGVRWAAHALLLFAAVMTVFYWLQRVLCVRGARWGLLTRRAVWRQPEVAIVGALAALSAWASGETEGLDHLDATMLTVTGSSRRLRPGPRLRRPVAQEGRA